MPQEPRLTEAEVAEIKRNRPQVRASFACEGIFFTEEEEALFDQFDEERLTGDQAAKRITEYLETKWAKEDASRK